MIVNTKLLIKMVLREFYELVAAAEVSTVPHFLLKCIASVIVLENSCCFPVKFLLLIILIIPVQFINCSVILQLMDYRCICMS